MRPIHNRIRKAMSALLALLVLLILAPAAAFAASAVTPLESVSYAPDDPTDGYANGTVTVDRGSTAAADCVMYWADGDGAPLEGLAPLAKFKLTGTVTEHEMYPYTVIPEGARKLIAYAGAGGELSYEAVSCDLPEGCTYHIGEEPLVEFQVMSDVHVTAGSAGGDVALANQHFAQMLEDIKKVSPRSAGIFINGDIANSGAEAEYQKVYDLWQSARDSGGTLPFIHMAVGNHDWIQGNPDSRFQRWVRTLNPALPEQPEYVYYDEVVSGYHFIYLGGEQAGLNAVLSPEQLAWFDGVMQRCTDEDPYRPVFVFLHQSFYDTVAGSLPGQGWHGVTNEDALKDVMAKYGQIVYFNGHSHWELDSERCVYGGDDRVPAALNTASVGYLWTSYDKTGGEFAPGSNAYYVKVYEDRIVFLGREFETGKYVPSALFEIRPNAVTTDKDVYEVPVNADCTLLHAVSENGGKLTYLSTNPDVAEMRPDGTVVPKTVGVTQIRIRSTADDRRVIGWKIVTVRVTESAEAEREEVILEPTCEEDGILRIWYKDGTYIDTRIPATGHSWGEWTYNNDRRTHSRVCRRDPGHTQTAECTFIAHSEGGHTVYTCSVCGGSYTSELLSTDKTVYAVGEPVMVTTGYSADGAWAGLYKKGEKWGTGAGTSKSIFWYYLSEQPNPVNILATRDENGRGGEYGAGEYTVVLFADGGYDAIAWVDFTVEEAAVPGPVFTLSVNGQTVSDGDEILFPRGTEAVTYSVSCQGDPGSAWIGRYDKLVTKETDFTSNPSDDWHWIRDCSGRDLRIEAPSKDIYTLVLFADSGYKPLMAVTLKAGSGGRITLEDRTGGKAETSLEADRLYAGETSFTVKAEAACLAAVRDPDGSCTALVCEGEEHSFTVNVTEAGATVVIAFLGDSNLDGKVSAKDATLIKRAVLGLAPFREDAALQVLTADTNRDGSISVKDATAVKQAVLGIAALPW